MLEQNIIGQHGSILRLRAEKSEIIAKNLANSNTPNYKAMDFSIKDALIDSPRKIQITNSKHFAFSVGKDVAIDLKYRNPNQLSMDGNTVESDQEIIRLADNNIRYQYSLKYAADKIRTITDILKEI